MTGSRPELEQTRYGFRWGPVNVIRQIEHQGHVVLGLKTARGCIDIRVTPTGFVRIWDKDGEKML